MKVSIIIPVLNEEKKLAATLGALQDFRKSGHEVIVVDGGSDDNTLAVCREQADRVIVSDRGRALQMNRGAAVATGDIYLFLHADTVLPDDAPGLVSSCCMDKLCWGRFDVRLSGTHKVFRLIETMMNIRSRLTSIATGDQAIFVTAKLFQEVDRFPEIALMEDIEICRRLKKLTRPVCLKARVITSSRRWETQGVLATILLMWKLRLYYFLGVSPQKLVRLYR